MAVENTAQPAHLVGCQEALPATPAIALDTGAGIGAVGTEAVNLGLSENHRENRCRTVSCHRRCMERGEPLLNVPARDVGNRSAPEPGQDLVSVVVEIDLSCAGFPVPLIAPEDLFGRHLERNRFGSISSKLITVPPRRQQGSHLRAGTLQGNVFGIVDCVPDPITVDLAEEKIALAARRQDPDAETLDFGIADVIGTPA